MKVITIFSGFVLALLFAVLCARIDALAHPELVLDFPNLRSKRRPCNSHRWATPAGFLGIARGLPGALERPTH